MGWLHTAKPLGPDDGSDQQAENCLVFSILGHHLCQGRDKSLIDTDEQTPHNLCPGEWDMSFHLLRNIQLVRATESDNHGEHRD